MVNNGKEEKKEDSSLRFNHLIDTLSSKLESLEGYTLHLTPDLAHAIFTDIKTSGVFLKLLFDLSELSGIVLGMHPESLYAEEYKVRDKTIFDRVLQYADITSDFIKMSLEVYQGLKSQIIQVTSNKILSHRLFVGIIKDTRWSFYGLLLQVIRSCKTLLTYLNYMESFELTKGLLTFERRKGGVIKHEEIDKLARDRFEE